MLPFFKSWETVHSSCSVHSSQVKFLGNLTSLPSRVVSSLPQGNDPFLLADLSRGKSTLKSSSLGPVPNLNVQFPWGAECTTFHAMKFREPGVAAKCTDPRCEPPHGCYFRSITVSGVIFLAIGDNNLISGAYLSSPPLYAMPSLTEGFYALGTSSMRWRYLS